MCKMYLFVDRVYMSNQQQQWRQIFNYVYSILCVSSSLELLLVADIYQAYRNVLLIQTDHLSHSLNNV